MDESDSKFGRLCIAAYFYRFWQRKNLRGGELSHLHDTKQIFDDTLLGWPFQLIASRECVTKIWNGKVLEIHFPASFYHIHLFSIDRKNRAMLKEWTVPVKIFVLYTMAFFVNLIIGGSKLVGNKPMAGWLVKFYLIGDREGQSSNRSRKISLNKRSIRW